MSKTIEEHKYWCPDYPNYCTRECDMKYCEGETFRKYMKSIDNDHRSAHNTHQLYNNEDNNEEQELNDDEIRDYVKTIVQQSDAIMRGGCQSNECTKSQDNKYSKWTISNNKY